MFVVVCVRCTRCARYATSSPGLHTERAISTSGSHSPASFASAGRRMSRMLPNAANASTASASLISCNREGTSAGFDSDGTLAYQLAVPSVHNHLKIVKIRASSETLSTTKVPRTL